GIRYRNVTGVQTCALPILTLFSRLFQFMGGFVRLADHCPAVFFHIREDGAFPRTYPSGNTNDPHDIFILTSLHTSCFPGSCPRSAVPSDQLHVPFPLLKSASRSRLLPFSSRSKAHRVPGSQSWISAHGCAMPVLPGSWLSSCYLLPPPG